MSAISSLTLYKRFKSHLRKSPDPPDFILNFKDGNQLWVEVVSAYANENIAKKYNHKLINGGLIRFVNIKNKENHINLIAKNCIKRIYEKDNKKNYKNFTKKYNRGILVIVINDPSLNSELDIEKILSQIKLPQKLNNFKEVYLCTKSITKTPVKNYIVCLPRDIWKIT